MSTSPVHQPEATTWTMPPVLRVPARRADREDSGSLNSMQLAHDAHTITVEIGREADADGYISDEEFCNRSEDEALMRRSASDFNVTPGSGYKMTSPRSGNHTVNGVRSKSTRISTCLPDLLERRSDVQQAAQACSKYMLEKAFPDPECSARNEEFHCLHRILCFPNCRRSTFFTFFKTCSFLSIWTQLLAIRLTGTQQMASAQSEASDEFVVMVNLFAARIFYDFCRDEYWCKAVQNKIQSKLATIHLPYFIETLELSKSTLEQPFLEFPRSTQLPLMNGAYG
uniref:Uncharacterized protein n=1 Tax=Ditylenchus dipsaci TaxID=166011 RepID=A0A915DPL9_9BILA